MNSAIDIHRLHFAFTVTFHYIFPQLTMGLALLIVVLKSLALFRRDELYSNAARFWARIFAINFALGMVTRIPMEFQFASGPHLVGMLTSVAFGVFPNVLPSNTAPDLNLTIHNAATAEHGSIVGLCWFIPGMPLAMGYSVCVYRHFAGRVD